MFKIANTIISPDHKPFVIAEMSGNHNQSLDRAFAIVDAAAEAGIHALKLQFLQLFIKAYCHNNYTCCFNKQ